MLESTLGFEISILLLFAGEQRDAIQDKEKEIEKDSRKQKNMLENQKRKLVNIQQHQMEMNRNNSRNQLERFGDGRNFVNLCNDIERANFQSKPIGPVGQYIRINEGTDDTLCTLIETQIRKPNLESFIVENKADRLLLEQLMARHFHRSKPHIIVRPSIGRRYDISRGRVPKDCNVQTILDHLTFENDEVFNFVVDSFKIEQILVTTDNIAQKLFRQKDSVPLNTKYAITRTFNRYNPPTRGNYASYYIRDPRDYR